MRFYDAFFCAWGAQAASLLRPAACRMRFLFVRRTEKEPVGKLPTGAGWQPALPRISPTRAILFLRFLRFLRLCHFRGGDQQLLPNLQFARIVDVIERDQTVVRNLELARDRHRIVAFGDDVSFS